VIKNKKTLIFAGAVILAAAAVYFFDYKAEQDKLKEQQAEILNYDLNQISFVQVVKPKEKIGLQKSETGWALLEPVQDKADDDAVETLLKQIVDERQISVVKKSEKDFSQEDLKEFGLDVPALVFNFKNNLGNTRKISVGSVKSYDGNSYLRVDSENKIILATPFWYAQVEKEMIFYREKKLYRHALVQVNKIKIKSLQEEFELFYKNNQWQSSQNSMVLDQNKVRDILKKLSETNIEQYLFEGEPSVKLVEEKGLNAAPVRLELFTDSTSWAVSLNLKTEDKALYGLTERPTFLVKVDLGAWETFGNITLDSLRDRTTALAFNLNEVKKIYYKENEKEAGLVAAQGAWKIDQPKAVTEPISNEQVKKTLNKIHDLKISEFIDDQSLKSQFEGTNMLILKSDTEKLVLQLNWGPSFKMKKAGEEKEYYYARTQLSDSIFALEKKVIDSLELDKLTTQPAAESAHDKVE
jgi:hypothetical protein